MEQARLLVVEDDADINQLLTTVLKKEGYEVISCYSGSEAQMRLAQQPYDLVLLDLMLPGLTGEQLIEEIRKGQITPIIVISAKGQQDKIQALKLGADDFITKPFDLEEVLARVVSQLRRCKQFAPLKREDTRLACKGLVLDTEALTACVDGKELALTAHEFGILKLLMAHPKRVFTRANLFETVWENPYLGDDNTINVHISNLRSKLAKAAPGREYIKTVWGIGFKLQDE